MDDPRLFLLALYRSGDRGGIITLKRSVRKPASHPDRTSTSTTPTRCRNPRGGSRCARINTKVGTCRDFFLCGSLSEIDIGTVAVDRGRTLQYAEWEAEFQPGAHWFLRNVRAGEQRDLTHTMQARKPVGCSSPHCVWVGRSSSTGSVSDKRAGAYSAGGRFPFWFQSAILRRVLQVHKPPRLFLSLADEDNRHHPWASTASCNTVCY